MTFRHDVLFKWGCLGFVVVWLAGWLIMCSESRRQYGLNNRDTIRNVLSESGVLYGPLVSDHKPGVGPPIRFEMKLRNGTTKPSMSFHTEPIERFPEKTSSSLLPTRTAALTLIKN
jgi:hypothetical protein